MKEGTALVRTRRIGGSIVVTIPAEITRLQNIGDNDSVKIRVSKIKKDYFGAFKGIGEFTEEDRMEDRE